MTNTPITPPDETLVPPPAAEPAAAGDAGAAEPRPPHPDDLAAALRVEIAELKDRLLRAQAEVENIRKRAEREKEDVAKYAVTRFARDIVTAADNFQRARAAVPAGAAEQDPALKTLVEGVTMSEREFVNVMERHGIRRIEPTGEMFNPHQHQAMMEMENAEVVPGTIVQVFQPGYLIEERVLRPALVVVAKGGAKPGKPAVAEAVQPAPAAAETATDSPSAGDGGDPPQG